MNQLGPPWTGYDIRFISIIFSCFALIGWFALLRNGRSHFSFPDLISFDLSSDASSNRKTHAPISEHENEKPWFGAPIFELNQSVPITTFICAFIRIWSPFKEDLQAHFLSPSQNESSDLCSVCMAKPFWFEIASEILIYRRFSENLNFASSIIWYDFSSFAWLCHAAPICLCLESKWMERNEMKSHFICSDAPWLCHANIGTHWLVHFGSCYAYMSSYITKEKDIKAKRYRSWSR